jgi:hypothetical protein
MPRYIVFALCLVAYAAHASCPQHPLTAPGQIHLTGDSLMIVTHASSNDDGRIASKFGVDEAVRYARNHRIPVVYLQDDRPAERYFMEDCSPDYWVYSQGGELPFDIDASHVYLAGGHLEICLSVTVNEILQKWTKKGRRNLTLSFFMDGIFSNGKEIGDSDVYYKDYLRFMQVVNYGRPAGEYFPKLTLLETMGVIVNETRQYDYLKRVLPRYDRTLGADYRVELSMSGSRPKLLQPGKKPADQPGRPPVLRFAFIDSADNLNYVGGGE